MEPRIACFGDAFRLTCITGDARFAAQADEAGVNRIGVDLERLGKSARQAGHDTRLSHHGWDDLAAVAQSIRQSALFVRSSAIHTETQHEIETALSLGVQALMLPNFQTADEGAAVARFVRGGALLTVLVATPTAVHGLRESLAVPGVDEVMIGLTDLHLQLGVSNHFEVLASPLIDMLAAEIRRKGLPLAVGGVGRVGDTSLPVPVELVYAQYPRLGATG